MFLIKLHLVTDEFIAIGTFIMRASYYHRIVFPFFK